MHSSFYTGNYPANHWAVQPYELNDTKVIGLAYYQESEYAIYVNPTDKRGYRCIVRFIKNDDMLSTINRNYTGSETQGLALIVQLIADTYRRILPISQTAMAGNNSHTFDVTTGVTYIGKPEEPSFLHGHIFGRGNPSHQYIKGVKLDGPNPGLNFDMMAKTPNEIGNHAKVKWGKDEMEKVVSHLKAELQNSIEEFTNIGIRVITA